MNHIKIYVIPKLFTLQYLHKNIYFFFGYDQIKIIFWLCRLKATKLFDKKKERD